MRNIAPKNANLLALRLVIPARAPNGHRLGEDAVNVWCVHTVVQHHQWNPSDHFPPRNPSLNTFGPPKLFDPIGFSNAVSSAGLVHQNQLPGATVNDHGSVSVPLSGTQMMGGG